ncbi:RHS repeat-associated core domain-containing protein [Rapidithrix thailandica]|uniref:RHS repeat-associated core domain-containing protein n=1 Tax=Rapidithrix thailandica TaxID=413964 RepID=A0AAW9RRJ8_9BACT
MYNHVGNLVWQAELDIYGKIRTLERGSPQDCPFRYQGQYEDVETGLYYNRFRYYSPESGTYISQDPIRLKGNNPNIYAYVSDSNVWVDVFGLSETFFRTISREHADILESTGKLPATKETFTSPTKVFSDGYEGVTYEFTMKDGTTAELEKIGVRDNSRLTRRKYLDMPEVKPGWTQNHAYFKQEGPKGRKQINIGLGKGKGLDIFNKNIDSFKKTCN